MRSLRAAKDFRDVRQAGRAIRRPGLTIVAAPRRDEEVRVGLAVGRRCGRAVTRNRIKRRLRAACRLADPAGVDLVLHARPEAATIPFPELVETVREAARVSS